MGTQPCEVSAYAAGKIAVPEGGDYTFDLGFDDWLCLWVNGEEIHRSRHERGFTTDPIAVRLPTGESEIQVKLSNMDNLQWRLWAFCLTVRKAE